MARRPNFLTIGKGSPVAHGEVHAQGAVLPAAFDDIPGLRVEVGFREIFNFEFSDPARLVQPRAPACSASSRVRNVVRATLTGWSSR